MNLKFTNQNNLISQFFIITLLQKAGEKGLVTKEMKKIHQNLNHKKLFIC